MGKFASKSAAPAVTSPVRVTTDSPTTRTHEGAPAFSRDPKGDLFLLAVTNMVGEGTFYEGGTDRDARFRGLIHQVAISDPDWVARLVPFLRNDMNMRSASVVMAAELVHAQLTDSGPNRCSIPLRQVVASALRRADEPAEMLAYWTQRYGRNIPKPVKRGVGDAVRSLVNEVTGLKYDGVGRAWRMGDVIDLVHPEPVAEWQSALFRYLLDRRHGREDVAVDASVLPLIAARRELEALPRDQRRARLADPQTAADTLRRAGATWEWLSGWLPGGMDSEAWEAVIPSMGYMALLRNLRNFDEAGVRDAAAQQVADRLADPEQVARSRQLPFRFLSAFKATGNVRWYQALEKALQASLSNVPALPGKSLVLIDTSGSMQAALSDRSTVQRVEAGILFGIALAARCEQVDVKGWASWTFDHELRKGASVLTEIQRFTRRVGEADHGTNMAAALQTWNGHDRVFLFSDMQTQTSIERCPVPAKVPIYGFNLGGYAPSPLASGTPGRHEFGGLSDAVFRVVPLLESGHSAGWPF